MWGIWGNILRDSFEDRIKSLSLDANLGPFVELFAWLTTFASSQFPVVPEEEGGQHDGDA